MSLRSLIVSVCLTLLIVACVPVPSEAPAPANADTGPASSETPPNSGMIAGLAVVDSVEVQVLEGATPSLLVIARGNFPDGCTAIDETSWVQEGNTFSVTITTVRPADEMCTQALVPFEETMLIEPEGESDGDAYTVEVNGVATELSL